jgi:signal transduction histidine kinase
MELADKQTPTSRSLRSGAGAHGPGGSRGASKAVGLGSSRFPLALLYASASIANAAESAEGAAAQIIALVLNETGWTAGRAFIRLSNDGHGGGRWLLVSGGEPSLPKELAGAERLTAEGPAAGSLAATALADGDVHCETSASRGLRCGCAVPIRKGEAILGVLEFYSEHTGEIGVEFKRALGEVAGHLGHVIARGWTLRASVRQQGELAQNGRLASMRELARNLAHEVNQPLAAVVAYAGGALQLLEQGRGDEQKMRRALEQIGLQAKRASGIIQEFREFLRREDPRHERLDVAALIRGAVDLLEDAAQEHGIAIALDLPADLPTIVGDPVQLQQVLINVMQNGIEAMAVVDVAERRLEISADFSDQMEIRVSDTGIGMAPELVPQLFTPFLTTKPHGLGMGLPICRSIVEFHGGRLSGENNPGGGMTFRIRLPQGR